MLKEENRSLRQEQSSLTRENSGLKREAEKLERRMENLSKLEEECSYLQEVNKTLQEETGLIQAQYEGILAEKEDLECQNREAIQALNEERDAKNALETKMKEASIHNHDDNPSWEVEKELTPPAASEPAPPKSPSPSDTLFLRTGSPGSGYKVHSTPYSPKKAPSLLSELQSSFMGNVDLSEFEALQKRCKEAEDSITALQKEKLTLQEKVTSLSLSKTEANTVIEQVREDYSKRMVERERELERLKEEMLIKEEMIGQLRNNLNSASAERASSEIEIDGLKDEIQRLKKSTSTELDKLQQECIQEQTRNVELKSEITVLQDRASDHIRAIEKLEGIIFSSHSELTSMTDDLQKLHRTVTRLSGEGKGASSNRNSIPDLDDTSVSDNLGESESIVFNLEIKKRKAMVPVHSESQSLQAINRLHEQLRSVRAPLEQFTKTMLEKSLARSVKHVSSDPNSPTTSVASEGRKPLDLEASVAKWRTKLAHKTEEVNNLRAIMKARATTAEVAISSLRSKLEGQSRTYQVELTRLKHQIKILKKEKDEHLSLRTMYAKRCEDYVDEITKMKRELQKFKMDNDELMLSLKKTIQRKLELSTELEEYRMEQERLHLIPKRLNSTVI